MQASPARRGGVAQGRGRRGSQGETHCSSQFAGSSGGGDIQGYPQEEGDHGRRDKPFAKADCGRTGSPKARQRGGGGPWGGDERGR